MYRTGASFAHASHAVNAVVFRRPHAKLAIATARQALRGWARRRTTTSYPPLTWELTVLIAASLAGSGHHGAAVALLLSFDCYLRVSEMCRLRHRDVIVPNDPRMGSSHIGMALALPKAKTGINQWVSLSNHQVGAVLLHWMQLQRKQHGVTRSSLVFPFSASHMRRLLHAACASLGVGDEHHPYVPHSLRHGGATHDFLRGATIEQVMYRGRWKAMESARRYIQQGAALLAAQRVPRRLHLSGQQLAAELLPLMQHLMDSVPTAAVPSQRRVSFAAEQQ